MNGKLSLGIAAAVLAVAFGGTAMAQNPEGLKTGASGQNSSALVTINIPAVVGIDVEHNFVLNLASNGCWGSGPAAFPMAPTTGNAIFTFAVNVASTADAANVGCVATTGGGQPDTATVKVFSTAAGTSTLKARLTDSGAFGTSGKKLVDLVPDLFSKLTLEDGGAVPCGGGSKHFALSIAASATDYNAVTAIPATAFSSCNQKLQLVMNTDTTAYTAGVATAKLTYTITTP